MLRYSSAFILLVALNAANSDNLFGPKYPATKGAVWPKPLQQFTENLYYKFAPHNLNITVTSHTCDILYKAIERYSFVGHRLHRLAVRSTRQTHTRRPHDEYFLGTLDSLKIELTAPCEEYPYYGMEESYNLTVTSVVNLKSSSIWGILHGLETLTQLFYLNDDGKEVRINKTHVSDAPRYLHRGLLVDTSRHFISLFNIKRTLDAMAMNKLNVFHWHIVDDQSFPYESEKFPDLSQQGAYHSTLVYSKEDIEEIIAYAKYLGIRVIPEFDVPGHTRSWGAAYPNILTACYRDGRATGLGPMNPISNVTYKLLQDLFGEVQQRFPDRYFHVGGDEVDLTCWNSNPELKAYMTSHGINAAGLHALFMANVIPLLANKSTPIVWQEVFDERVPIPKDTIVQVWTGAPIYEMLSILQEGYKVIFSTSWYLDHLKTGGDWEEFYKADPRQMVSYMSTPSIDLQNIVGGEACMWGEVVDDTNIMTRVWPRASAVAEKLWSPPSPSLYTIPIEVYHRLEEHSCRMRRRGIPAQPPSGPGFCIGAV